MEDFYIIYKASCPAGERSHLSHPYYITITTQGTIKDHLISEYSCNNADIDIITFNCDSINKNGLYKFAIYEAFYTFSLIIFHSTSKQLFFCHQLSLFSTASANEVHDINLNQEI